MFYIIYLCFSTTEYMENGGSQDYLNAILNYLLVYDPCIKIGLVPTSINQYSCQCALPAATIKNQHKYTITSWHSLKGLLITF